MKSSIAILAQYTAPGELFEELHDKNVRCFACGHRCQISDGKSGICRVRFNRDGILQVPFGYVSGVQRDPIEKKPFFHVRPGAPTLSFGMLGCNFHCGFCQNWTTSQTLRDADCVPYISEASPGGIVQTARMQRAEIVVSTYNEPLISSEWAVAVFREAKAAGLMTAYVSNGCGTPEVVAYLEPWVDMFNIDLKCYDASRYRQLGGQLQAVLDTIRLLSDKGKWIEIVTLLVPGFNDSMDELQQLTAFIKEVSPDIPWHVTAFHKSYRMTEPRNTTAKDLLRAAEVGRAAGLRYIYTGNLPGSTAGMENTRCSNCGSALVERIGFQVLGFSLTAKGDCPTCGIHIPGLWGSKNAQGRD
jgi:pyruvate formate lyase activating enzyme